MFYTLALYLRDFIEPTSGCSMRCEEAESWCEWPVILSGDLEPLLFRILELSWLRDPK